MKDSGSLNINTLRYFCAIYEEQSISQAAHKVNRKQPTLTQAMNTLRERYRDDLFVATEKGMMPTRLARELYEKFREILSTLHSLDDLAQASAGNLDSIEYVLGVNDYYLSVLLQRNLDSLLAYLPDAHISFEKLLDGPSGNYSEKIAELKLGQLDAVVCEYRAIDKDLKQKKIVSDSWALVIPSHSINDDLSSMIYVRCGIEEIDTSLVNQYQFQYIVDPLPEFSYLPDLIMSGNYISALPSMMINAVAHRANALSIHSDLGKPYELYLYWSNNRHYDPIFEILKNTLVRDSSYLVQEKQFFSER